MDATQLPVTGLEDDVTLQLTVQLDQNFPNPCKETTSIGYYLPKSSLVTLHCYDRLGKEVATLINENRPAGRHTVSFRTGDLPTGIYEYVLKTQDSVLTGKMICIK